MSYVFSKALKTTPEERERRRTLPPKWTTPNVPHHKIPPPVAAKPKANGNAVTKEPVKSHEAPVKGSLEVNKAPIRKTSLPARTYSQDYGTTPKMGGAFARLQAKLEEEPTKKSGLYSEAYEAYRIKRSLKEHGVIPSDLRSTEQLRKYSLDKDTPPAVLPRSRGSSTSSEKRAEFASNRSQTTPTSPTGNFFHNNAEHESVFEENPNTNTQNQPSPKMNDALQEPDNGGQEAAKSAEKIVNDTEKEAVGGTVTDGTNTVEFGDLKVDVPNVTAAQEVVVAVVVVAENNPAIDHDNNSNSSDVVTPIAPPRNPITAKQDEGREKLNEIIQALEDETFEDHPATESKKEEVQEQGPPEGTSSVCADVQAVENVSATDDVETKGAATGEVGSPDVEQSSVITATDEEQPSLTTESDVSREEPSSTVLANSEIGQPEQPVSAVDSEIPSVNDSEFSSSNNTDNATVAVTEVENSSDVPDNAELSNASDNADQTPKINVIPTNSATEIPVVVVTTDAEESKDTILDPQAENGEINNSSYTESVSVECQNSDQNKVQVELNEMEPVSNATQPTQTENQTDANGIPVHVAAQNIEANNNVVEAIKHQPMTPEETTIMDESNSGNSSLTGITTAV